MMNTIFKRHKQLVFLVLLPVIFTQFSCGLINDQDLSQEVYNIGSLQSVCKIDTEKFKKIITEDIHPQINCLERNLDNFAKFVRRKDQNVIARDELKRFMTKFMKIEYKLTEDLLYVIFQINSLVLKDKPNSIKVSNIKSFISLIHILNKEGIKLKDLLDDIKKDGYLSHREKMVNLLRKQSDLIRVIVDDRVNMNFKIRIIEFLKKIKDSFKIPHKSLDLKIVDSLLFVKKLFIGGKSEEITSDDMDIMIERLPQLVKVFFDALNVNPEYFKADSDFYQFQIENLNEFESIVLKLNLNEVLINHKDLVNLLAQLVPKYDWKYMSKALLLVKRDFVKGDGDEYTFDNFRKFLSLYRESLEIRFFNSLSYELLKEELDSPLAINTLTFPDSDSYDLLTEARQKELWREFEHIIKNYRVYTTADMYIQYSFNYTRTANGVNLLAIERWFGQKIFKIYASDKTIDFEEGLTKEQSRNIVYNYEEILVEFGILNNGAERLIRELMMGSDLFQQSSNGDNKIQIDELAQVIPMVISSNKFGSHIFDEMDKYCDPLKISDGFDLKCYRENFFPILFYDLNFDKYYPNTFEYFKQSNHSTIMQFLKDAEGQAKIDQSPLSPMTRTDMRRMMANISNSEALFLKYDDDKNGYFSSLELNKIYLLFEQTLSGISKLKPGSKLLRSLFSYIVVKKKLPSKIGLIKFHLLGRKKKITATRANIAAILGMIGKRIGQEH